MESPRRGMGCEEEEEVCYAVVNFNKIDNLDQFLHISYSSAHIIYMLFDSAHIVSMLPSFCCLATDGVAFEQF